MRHLVEDLRTLSLADNGAIILIRQPVSICTFLENLTKIYNNLSSKKEIRLSVDCKQSLPEIEIDPDRMEQAMGNLISNAIRHTSRGGEITLSAYGNDNEINISIRDNGEGINPEILPFIFERFHRGDESRHDDGSGLGLPITKSLVELHGGSNK